MEASCVCPQQVTVRALMLDSNRPHNMSSLMITNAAHGITQPALCVLSELFYSPTEIKVLFYIKSACQRFGDSWPQIQTCRLIAWLKILVIRSNESPL